MRDNPSNDLDQFISALAAGVAFGVAAHVELGWGWSASLLAGLVAFDVTAIMLRAARFAASR